jgi:hypothetical protein
MVDCDGGKRSRMELTKLFYGQKARRPVRVSVPWKADETVTPY